jgi:hypothetical protein
VANNGPEKDSAVILASGAMAKAQCETIMPNDCNPPRNTCMPKLLVFSGVRPWRNNIGASRNRLKKQRKKVISNGCMSTATILRNTFPNVAANPPNIMYSTARA